MFEAYGIFEAFSKINIRQVAKQVLANIQLIAEQPAVAEQHDGKLRLVSTLRYDCADPLIQYAHEVT